MRRMVLVLVMLGAFITVPSTVVFASFGCASQSGGSVASDFNGDDFCDLAIGIPYEDVTFLGDDAGAVAVMYGSPGALTPAGSQFLHQNSTEIEDQSEVGDFFGASLTTGDFDGDGYADLAVGAPGENVGSITDAGAVNVIYGSSSGLTGARDQLWHQNTGSIQDSSESSDAFGYSLAAGNFDGDGFTDLAVGVRREVIGGVVNAGAVNVIYGSTSGLTSMDNRLWHQNIGTIEDTIEPNDGFGETLTSGDFSGDGYTDLAVGVPYESVGSLSRAGAVNVIYGSFTGLTDLNDQLWHQNSAEIEGNAETGDEFGRSLAAGDFDGNGVWDLAIGVPNEDVGSVFDAGAVNVIYGNEENRLSNSGDEIWDQGSANIEGTPENTDRFGASLAAGDFNGDNRTDLAIGSPGESIGSIQRAGAVNAIYASTKDGLSSAGDELWHQNVSGVEGAAESLDEFGATLAAADFDQSGTAELAIGVPFEDNQSITNSGAVNVLIGAYFGGLTSGSLDRIFDQNTLGTNPAESQDQMGSSLAAGGMLTS
jgi:hypothetical protein